LALKSRSNDANSPLVVGLPADAAGQRPFVSLLRKREVVFGE
jgi:hypothetical protein